MGNKAKIGLSVGIFVLIAGGIVSYDAFLKDKINTEEVVVVKQGVTVKESQTLDNSVLAIENRPKTQVPDDAITSAQIDSIAGKTASVNVTGNSVLTKEQVDYDNLVPNKEDGEAIRPITADMLFATAGTLRRGDEVTIYALTENQWGEATHSDNEQVVTDTNDLVAKNEPILKDVKVAYVRDGSNNEVQNATQTQSESSTDAVSQSENSDARLNGTSTVSELEVILKEDDFQKLMTQVTGQGKKLYIVYN